MRRGIGRLRAGTNAFFPLDAVTGAGPVFAYGVKRLRSAYTGSALRVVRASDSATADIGFTASGALDESGLSSFLAGTTGKVDKWYDQSGNANDATQTTDASRPQIGVLTIAGSRGLYFNTMSMAIPVGSSIDRNSMYVYTVAENNATNGQSSFWQLGSSTNQASVLRISGPAQPYLSINPGANSLLHPQSKPCVYEHVLTASAAEIYQDADVYTTTGTTSVAMAGGLIGNTALSAGFDAINYTAAVVGYSRTFTSPQRATLRSGLGSLFGTSVNTGRVIFEGDSITVCSAPTNAMYYGFAKIAQRSFSKAVSVYNTASGGTQLQNKIGAAFTGSSGAGTILAAFSDNRVLLLACGTNDLTIGARTAAQIYADTQTYAGLVRAAGGKVIVSTLLPNSAWSGAQQTTWNDFNTSVRSGWASFADGLCDFQASAVMGPFAAASDTSLYADGLHPTVLGHTYLAPIAAAAINALL